MDKGGGLLLHLDLSGVPRCPIPTQQGASLFVHACARMVLGLQASSEESDNALPLLSFFDISVAFN